MFLKVKKKNLQKEKKNKERHREGRQKKRTIQENHSLAKYNSFPMNYSSLLQILLIISEITSAQLMSFYFFVDSYVKITFCEFSSSKI